MTARATLLLHADDFGMSRAVTAGILTGFTRGVLTSTSILANAPAFEFAIEAWKQLARRTSERPYDLGVHLNLTQGRPLTDRAFPAELLDRQGRFPGIGGLFVRLLTCRKSWSQAIQGELSAQIERTLATGVTVTHLNGHQYVELLPAVREIMFELAAKYGIGVVRCACEGRLATTLKGPAIATRVLSAVKGHYALQFARRLPATCLRSPAQFFGSAHAGRIDAGVIERFLTVARQAAAGKPTTVEIALHPGLRRQTDEVIPVEDGWRDPLATLRPGEWQLVTSDELKRFIARSGFELGRLSDLAGTTRLPAAA